VERGVADTESELANCIGAIYEAVANGESWEDVGAFVPTDRRQ
jgi:hypothetical protein